MIQRIFIKSFRNITQQVCQPFSGGKGFDKFNRKNNKDKKPPTPQKFKNDKSQSQQTKKQQNQSKQKESFFSSKQKQDEIKPTIGFNRFRLKKKILADQKKNQKTENQQKKEKNQSSLTSLFSKNQKQRKEQQQQAKNSFNKFQRKKVDLTKASSNIVNKQAEIKQKIKKRKVNVDKMQNKDQNEIENIQKRRKLRKEQKKIQNEQFYKKLQEDIMKNTTQDKKTGKESVEENIQYNPNQDEQKKQEQKWNLFENILSNKRQRMMFQNRITRFQRKKIQQMSKNLTQNSESQKTKPLQQKQKMNYLIFLGLGLALVFYLFEGILKRSGKQVDSKEMMDQLQNGNIVETWLNQIGEESSNSIDDKSTKIRSTVICARLMNNQVIQCVSNSQFENIWQKHILQHNLQALEQQKQLQSGKIFPQQITKRPITVSETEYNSKSNKLSTIRSLLSIALLFLFVRSIFQMRQGGKGMKGGAGGLGDMFGGKQSYRFKQEVGIRFKDVMGMQKSKEQIVQFIDFLKHPKRYHKLGARIPRGALLTGPPGTGKTMIAKACAGQSQVPFFSISGSEFIEMYVGVGAQRVRNLFKEAKENSPSIIFIDEIDAIGKKRSGSGGGNDERDTTLNQLLIQMDGFETSSNVIIFAATNQKDILDPALTRPGRFDRLIEVDLPDIQGRKQISQVHLKPLILDEKLNKSECARRLATLTPGFSGADIKNACNQAAIFAARGQKAFISMIDFEMAIERIIGGVQKKSSLITEETRRTVAYHECGHGVVSWFIEHASPLLKLTIIPRSKGALGFAQYLPSEHQMYTKQKLLDEICVILGGRISQQIFFGKISTGASDDLNKAYKIAKTFVTQYGFGDKVGWMQYDETEYAKQYSKDVENRIDDEMLNIMSECSKITRRIILEKKKMIEKLAETLLEKETIDQIDIEEVLGPRPFKMSKQHQQYIKEKKRMGQETEQNQQIAEQATTPLCIPKKIEYIL